MTASSQCINLNCTSNCCNYYGTCPQSYSSFRYSSRYTTCYYDYPNKSGWDEDFYMTIIWPVVGFTVFIVIGVAAACYRRYRKSQEESGQCKVDMTGHEQVIVQNGGLEGTNNNWMANQQTPGYNINNYQYPQNQYMQQYPQQHPYIPQQQYQPQDPNYANPYLINNQGYNQPYLAATNNEPNQGLTVIPGVTSISGANNPIISRQ